MKDFCESQLVNENTLSILLSQITYWPLISCCVRILIFFITGNYQILVVTKMRNLSSSRPLPSWLTPKWRMQIMVTQRSCRSEVRPWSTQRTTPILEMLKFPHCRYQDLNIDPYYQLYNPKRTELRNYQILNLSKGGRTFC